MELSSGGEGHPWAGATGPSQGLPLLLGCGIGMEDPSNMMEQGGVSVQLSKSMKFNKIKF